MERLTPLEKDYYLDHDDIGGRRSDGEYDSESSEDDVQRMLADIAGVQLPSQRKRRTAGKLKFEDEMERELDVSFQAHNAGWAASATGASKTNAVAPKPILKASTQMPEPMVVDEKKETPIRNAPSPTKRKTPVEDVDPAIGLNDKDTESDEEFTAAEGLKTAVADDETNILYDEDDDDVNQNWVDTHRRSYQPHSSKNKPLPKSDAVLNCPACMTLLCLDCQRHDVYKTQYRAMFVLNCDVQRDVLLYQPRSLKRGGAKTRQNIPPTTPQLKSGQRMTAEDYSSDAMENIKRDYRPEDLFYPVVCGVCKTEVGVYDTDEIYHFFNILASYA